MEAPPRLTLFSPPHPLSFFSTEMKIFLWSLSSTDNIFSPDLVFGTFAAVLRASLLNHPHHQSHLIILVTLNLAIAMYLRLEVWTGTSWPIWVPPVITVLGIILFVVYAIDEDKDALEYSRRPYSTQTLDKAYPGSRRD